MFYLQWHWFQPCRFEYMGKVHFPWRFPFPFLMWWSMKSVCGFAVLMPSEVQIVGAVFHQQCSSAGADLMWHPPAQFWNSVPQVLDWIWAWSFLNWAGNFPSGVSVVRICYRGVQDTTNAGLCWGQPDLNPKKSESARFILGKEQFSLLHCLRKQCCEWIHVRNQIALGRWVKIIL